MGSSRLVGLNPALPWPLNGSLWWTEPVRAERLASLRIGTAVVLLLDICLFYGPTAAGLYPGGTRGDAQLLHYRDAAYALNWSLLRGLTDAHAVQLALLIWAAAGLLLLLGIGTRLAAVVAWLLSVSFVNLNPYVNNSGDTVRSILLFYLMLTPCAAVWSVTSWRRGADRVPVFVPAWPVRLLFIQMVFIYFVNGACKLAGPGWRNGEALYYVMANTAWTRFPYAELPFPDWTWRVLALITVFWELAFPLLVQRRTTRILALLIGAGFHLGTALVLRLGPFPFYMLCLYLPLVPWERWSSRHTVSTLP